MTKDVKLQMQSGARVGSERSLSLKWGGGGVIFPVIAKNEAPLLLPALTSIVIDR